MHDHLLHQARRLARSDPRRPRQANLRRAISAAYYAAFHFLIAQATRAMLGSQPARIRMRQVLGRSFRHADMKDACDSFAGGSLPAAVATGLGSSFHVALEIRAMARIFADLQQSRHQADYDLTERFLRSDVLLLIDQVESSIATFRSFSDAA